ncbi:MAG: nucleoside phosphorylase [Anaerolineaceae bacterium]|nr:nucleoside phosphorylase [Anaerolineaceae bacterium]
MVNIPIDAKSYGEPAAFTAQELLKLRQANREIPYFTPLETVIICYATGALHDFIRRHPVRSIKCLAYDLFLIKETKGRLALAGNLGIGSPATAALVEELVALHVKRFFAIGKPGSLQHDLLEGDILLCERAIRDKGTSYHYLAPARTVDGCLELLTKFGNMLQSHRIAYKQGASWTTDAPYRETRQEIENFQSEGIQTVEMEAATLFAVAQYLRVKSSAAFVISDSLADHQLQINKDPRLIQSSIRSVLDAALYAFSGGG